MTGNATTLRNGSQQLVQATLVCSDWGWWWRWLLPLLADDGAAHGMFSFRLVS
jgi:hypothetical protein